MVTGMMPASGTITSLLSAKTLATLAWLRPGGPSDLQFESTGRLNRRRVEQRMAVHHGPLGGGGEYMGRVGLTLG
jgi:hypothetical protein